MARFEIIKSKAWKHVDGRTAAIGSVPWSSLADSPNWELVERGWTVRNPYTGQIGIGRAPWATREEAEAWALGRVPGRVAIGE